MVGKLNLDLGDDYAFDIRRAREVAEGGSGDVVAPIPAPDPLPPGGVDGPNSSANGDDYWLQNDNGTWFIWFNIDADPDPDARILLTLFLSSDTVAIKHRVDVRKRAEALGWVM